MLKERGRHAVVLSRIRFAIDGKIRPAAPLVRASDRPVISQRQVGSPHQRE